VKNRVLLFNFFGKRAHFYTEAYLTELVPGVTSEQLRNNYGKMSIIIKRKFFIHRIEYLWRIGNFRVNKRAIFKYNFAKTLLGENKMAIKKTGSPLSSGAESLDPLGGKDPLRQSAKVDKNFEAALAEAAGQIEQAGSGEKGDGAVRSAFQQIASNANLDSPEGAMSAVRESARFLVSSRLKDGMRDSEQGRKISEDLSNYISRDPFMHRKILGILQRFK